jgi:hypothetical protein
VTENELPEWLPSALRDAQAYAEQAQEAADVVRMMMPALRDAQRYAALTREVLELSRSAWPTVEYIQRHTEQTEQVLAVAGLLLAHADQVVLGANLSLLRPADRAAGPRHHTVGAALTVTPTFTVRAEVVKADDSSKDVDTQSDTRPEARRSIDLAALGVKLLIAWALIFPMVQALMTPEQQEIFGCYIATIALALTVAWRYNDKHKD